MADGRGIHIDRYVSRQERTIISVPAYPRQPHKAYGKPPPLRSHPDARKVPGPRDRHERCAVAVAAATTVDAPGMHRSSAAAAAAATKKSRRATCILAYIPAPANEEITRSNPRQVAVASKGYSTVSQAPERARAGGGSRGATVVGAQCGTWQG